MATSPCCRAQHVRGQRDEPRHHRLPAARIDDARNAVRGAPLGSRQREVRMMSVAMDDVDRSHALQVADDPLADIGCRRRRLPRSSGIRGDDLALSRRVVDGDRRDGRREGRVGEVDDLHAARCDIVPDEGGQGSFAEPRHEGRPSSKGREDDGGVERGTSRGDVRARRRDLLISSRHVGNAVDDVQRGEPDEQPPRPPPRIMLHRLISPVGSMAGCSDGQTQRSNVRWIVPLGAVSAMTS